MSHDQPPAVDLALSISPSTFSFSSQKHPPTLKITIVSRASQPITIFTWRSPFDAHTGLVSNAFVITDLTTNIVIEQAKVMIQRGPLKRVRGSSDEACLLTLEPHVPIELITRFGRGEHKPQPKEIAERGWEVDENGREIKIRRSVHPTGVDGLEAEHEYLVGFDAESLRNSRWTFGRRDDVLVDENGEGADMQDYPWEVKPLRFATRTATLKVEA